MYLPEMEEYWKKRGFGFDYVDRLHPTTGLPHERIITVGGHGVTRSIMIPLNWQTGEMSPDYPLDKINERLKREISYIWLESMMA